MRTLGSLAVASPRLGKHTLILSCYRQTPESNRAWQITSLPPRF